MLALAGRLEIDLKGDLVAWPDQRRRAMTTSRDLWPGDLHKHA